MSLVVSLPRGACDFAGKPTVRIASGDISMSLAGDYRA